jgi:hypothetical protein
VLTALVVQAQERRAPPGAPGVPEATPAPLERWQVHAAWLLVLLGTSSALALRFLLDGLPRAGAGPGASAPAITTAFFVGMALTAVPAGRIALGRIGGGPVTLTGLAVLIVGALAFARLEAAGAVLVAAGLLGAALAALQNGLFAWSLCAVSTERSGLGMGLLFGGGGLALGSFNLLVAVRKPAPGTSLLAAAGLYAVTLLLLGALRQTTRRRPVV